MIKKIMLSFIVLILIILGGICFKKSIKLLIIYLII